jgi:short-subunit dehydrogenase
VLRGSSVFVSVINPGPMPTNKEITDRISHQGWLGKASSLQPEHVAQVAIDSLLKRDSVIMVSPLIWLLSVILPIWIKIPLMTSIVNKALTEEKSLIKRC